MVLIGTGNYTALLLMSTTKTGLVPSEDTGSIFVSLDAPAGSTLAETASIMDKVEKS